jgi:hypothetical protein
LWLRRSRCVIAFPTKPFELAGRFLVPALTRNSLAETRLAREAIGYSVAPGMGWGAFHSHHMTHVMAAEHSDLLPKGYYGAQM